MRGADALGAALIAVLDGWEAGADPAPRSPYDGRGTERFSAEVGRWLSPLDPNPLVGDDCCTCGRLLFRSAPLGRGNERSGAPFIALFEDWEPEFDFDCGGRGTCRIEDPLSPILF